MTPKPTKFISPEPLALRPLAHLSRGVVFVSSLIPHDSFFTARAQLASGLYNNSLFYNADTLTMFPPEYSGESGLSSPSGVVTGGVGMLIIAVVT